MWLNINFLYNIKSEKVCLLKLVKKKKKQTIPNTTWIHEKPTQYKKFKPSTSVNYINKDKQVSRSEGVPPSCPKIPEMSALMTTVRWSTKISKQEPEKHILIYGKRDSIILSGHLKKPWRLHHCKNINPNWIFVELQGLNHCKMRQHFFTWHFQFSILTAVVEDIMIIIWI